MMEANLGKAPGGVCVRAWLRVGKSERKRHREEGIPLGHYLPKEGGGEGRAGISAAAWKEALKNEMELLFSVSCGR